MGSRVRAYFILSTLLAGSPLWGQTASVSATAAPAGGAAPAVFIQVSNAAQAKEYAQLIGSSFSLSLSGAQKTNITAAQTGDQEAQLDVMAQSAQQEYGALLQQSVDLEKDRQNELTQLAAADTEDKKLNCLLQLEGTLATEKVLSARVWALKAIMASAKEKQQRIKASTQATAARASELNAALNQAPQY